jgi:predicted aminopeptidase
MMCTMRKLISLVLVPVSLVLTGCDLDVPYALHAVNGQLVQSAVAVPIEDAIDSGNLSEEQVRKLQLIQEAREFARTHLGLNVDNSFQLFYDSGDQPALTNVSASQRDHFEPLLWTIPFVGTLPHLGFFDIGTAEAKKDELRAAGLDVYSYEVDAYTNGPPLQNAVLSHVLNRSDEDLVDLVIHELLHATIWRSSDASFNESLATFVGMHGALQFFEEKAGSHPGGLQAAHERYEDRSRYRAFALETYGELDAYYSSPLSPEEKIGGRDALFEAARARFIGDVQPLMNHPERYEFVKTLEINNAYLLLFRRYNLDMDVFDGVLARAGTWSGTMRVFHAAATAEVDAYEYLRTWPGPTQRKH